MWVGLILRDKDLFFEFIVVIILLKFFFSLGNDNKILYFNFK